MKFSAVLLFVVLFSVNSYSIDEVIGGSRTSNMEHPWQLSLQVKYSGHLCGASLVKKNVVLTAAHCVDSFGPRNLRLKGMSSTGDVDDLRRLPRIKEIHIHPDFDPDNIVANDIAVIILRGNAQLGSGLQTIDLPLDQSFDIENEFRSMSGRMVSSGWGSTDTPTRFPVYSDELMEVDVKAIGVTKTDLKSDEFRNFLINEYNMSEELNDYIAARDSNVLLTTGVVAETGNCLGDSGGPLVYYGSERPLLIGITSYAVGGTKLCKGLAGFTNIQAYADWLKQYL